jgi:hypothetical protein
VRLTPARRSSLIFRSLHLLTCSPSHLLYFFACGEKIGATRFELATSRSRTMDMNGRLRALHNYDKRIYISTPGPHVISSDYRFFREISPSVSAISAIAEFPHRYAKTSYLRNILFAANRIASWL